MQGARFITARQIKGSEHLNKLPNGNIELGALGGWLSPKYQIANVAFLAAWLSCALKDAEVREMVVYAFSPDAHKRSNWRGRHIHLLNSSQRKVLQTFLAYCVDIESSKYIKQHAQAALEYVKSMTE